jgi:hypothetical protein
MEASERSENQEAFLRDEARDLRNDRFRHGHQ